MKRQNIIKKYLIGLGTVSAVAVPIATAVSCGSLLGGNGAYDSDNDNKIVIQTTWSAGGEAISALEDVVDKYNESQSGTVGYIPVQIEHVEGGYGTIPSQILTKIQSQDKKTLPNLYIDYPSAVGQINPYNMTYDMSDVIDRSWFIDQFVDVNDKIAGISSGGLYSIPLAKSTEALAIDKPLMHWLFNKLVTAGATIDRSTGIVKEIMDQTISSGDASAIASQWGDTKPGADASAITIDNKVFTTYKGLFDFINAAQPLFLAPGRPNILGIDSPSNMIYELATLQTYNKKEDFLFTKKGKSGYVEFDFLKNGTPQSKLFRDSYDMIKSIIDSGATWIGGGGAYGSTRLLKHQMGISISSSAGLYHAYDRHSQASQDLNKNETLFTLPIDRMNKTSGTDSVDVNGTIYDRNKVTSTITQGPSFNSVHISQSEDAATKKFLAWLYKTGKSDTIGGLSPIDHFSKKSSYIVPVKGALDDTSVIGKLVNKSDYAHSSDTVLGVKASFETIKRELKHINDNGNSAGFVQLPVDDMTGGIRKIIDSKIAASGNSKNNGGSSYSSTQLWNDIHRQAIIDQTIEDDGTLSTKYSYPNMLNRNFSDINWTKYSYVDAEIVSWTDGDTPNVKVLSTSGSDAVKSIHAGDELAIRISGIDTPEAHVKLGELKYKDPVDGKLKGFTDAEMKKVIDKYKTAGNPLAVYSNGHYNELSMDKTSRYTYWANIYTDIQDIDGHGTPFDKVIPDPNHSASTYDLRSVKVEIANGNEVNLVTNTALKEGYWGYKAGELGRQEMPKGTRIRIATDGKKSYNRIVGSIFYGINISKNWSVEITRRGLTLPFLSNPASVLDRTSIHWHNGQAIADAFNYALDHKLGLFNSNDLKQHLKELLATHGATDYGSLIKYDGQKPAGAPTSIYDYMKTRKPDPTLYRGGH